MAAQAEGGLLSANTSPWSYLDVDGRRLRSTPVVRHPISAGRHTLRFHNPAEGLERTVTIDVEPGEHERVSFDL